MGHRHHIRVHLCPGTSFPSRDIFPDASPMESNCSSKSHRRYSFQISTRVTSLLSIRLKANTSHPITFFTREPIVILIGFYLTLIYVLVFTSSMASHSYSWTHTDCHKDNEASHFYPSQSVSFSTPQLHHFPETSTYVTSVQHKRSMTEMENHQLSPKFVSCLQSSAPLYIQSHFSGWGGQIGLVLHLGQISLQLPYSGSH
jgi:hypothetical protein